MGFKNMKRDDHGHVISNDETDGQKCQHQSGGSKSQDNSERENLRKEVEYKLKTEGNTSDVRLMAERRGFKIEDGKVVEDLKSQAMADRATGGSGEAFDDDYDEEFDAWDREHMNTDKEPDARPNHTKLNDMNLSDSELWNMAYQYIGNDKLEKLAESLDLDSPQDLTTNDMLQAMPDDDIGDMMRINGLDDEFEDESQEEYEARIKPEAEKFKKQLDDAGYKLKDKEYGVEKKEPALDKNLLKKVRRSVGPGAENLAFIPVRSKEDAKKLADELKEQGFDADMISNLYDGTGILLIPTKEIKDKLGIDNKELNLQDAIKSENLDESQGLDKLGISQGFGKRVSKNQFEEYVKLSDEDKQKLRKQGFLQNYHGYDIEEVDGKDEYRIWKLGK